MELEAWKLWIDVGQWAFNLLIAIYLFISKKHQTTKKKVADLDCKIETVEKDIVKIQTELKLSPSQDQIQKLNDTMTALGKEIGNLEGRLGGINRAVDLINEHLINKDKS